MQFCCNPGNDLNNVYHVARRKWLYFVRKAKKIPYLSKMLCIHYKEWCICPKNCKSTENNYDILNSNSYQTLLVLHLNCHTSPQHTHAHTHHTRFFWLCFFNDFLIITTQRFKFFLALSLLVFQSLQNLQKYVNVFNLLFSSTEKRGSTILTFIFLC